MGTSVNLGRLTERYKKLMEKKTRGFALFVDFKSAYNTVLHSKLFKRLKKVLSPQEIDLIRTLYSRQTISIGDHEFTPNCGVAPGSLISPGLFNIYVEPLYQKIEKEGISGEGILAYADDLLIICSSLEQLQRVIKCIKKWCTKNNIQLNEKKSGILELLPRMGNYRPRYKNIDTMEGIPFTTSYKYLGTWITSKMSMKPQLDHIRKKTDFIVNKLYPLLNEVSLSYRINLWTILLRPLFDQLAQLYTIEKAKSNLLKAERIYKYSFKRFTLLTKRTPDALIYELTGVTLQDRANSITTNAERKWHD